MNAQITSGRGDRFMVIDTENGSIVTNAVILFPYQDKIAYLAYRYYAELYIGKNVRGDMLEELDKLWTDK